MSDLVKRLRHTDEYEPLGHDGWEAADRIEELEAALRHIAKNWPDSFAARTSRAALNKQGETK